MTPQMRNSLGIFEFYVLLSVEGLNAQYYAVTVPMVMTELHVVRMFPATGAIYTAFTRLQKKGFLTSKMGRPEKRRGGRAVRQYKVTKKAIRQLEDMRDQIHQLDHHAL